MENGHICQEFEARNLDDDYAAIRVRQTVVDDSQLWSPSLGLGGVDVYFCGRIDLARLWFTIGRTVQPHMCLASNPHQWDEGAQKAGRFGPGITPIPTSGMGAQKRLADFPVTS